MSPGGLDSLAFGLAVCGVLVVFLLFDEPPPQPATTTAAISAVAVIGMRTFIGLHSLGRSCERTYGPLLSTRQRPGNRQVKVQRWVSRGDYVERVETREILLVEDDDAIANGLVRVLESQSYRVQRLSRGTPALRAATPEIGLVILDLGLPDVDGIDVCRKLRAARPDLAILILTARDQEIDVVAGLDAGADDYLIKPFRLSELLARVRAHLRRSAGDSEEEPLRAGEVTIDRGARRAWSGGEELALRPKE